MDGRSVLPQRGTRFHPDGIEAARTTEPGRARRFLPVRDERLQEPALLWQPDGPGIGEGVLRTS